VSGLGSIDSIASRILDNSLGPLPLGQLPSGGSAGRIKPTGRAQGTHTGNPGTPCQQARAAVWADRFRGAPAPQRWEA